MRMGGFSPVDRESASVNFLRKLFGGGSDKSFNSEELPPEWQRGGVPAEPEEGELNEPLGPHMIRKVLQKDHSGRLLKADFQGRRDKPIFIKEYPTLKKELQEHPESRVLWQAELQSVIQFSHKFLYPLRAYHLDDDVYLIFDVVPTTTLQDVMDQVELTPAEACAYIERLLQVADVIHSHGAKLGEIRPASIWLTKSRDLRLVSGQWVLDYAYARRADRMTAANSNMQVGGVEYLSPEIIRGEKAGQTTDQYIIGAILFRLLTRKSVAGDDSVVLHRVMKIVGGEPPKPSVARPELGTAFDELLERMLARDPDQRYPTCGQIVEPLREALKALTR